jgi:hypothetical protein
MKLGPSTVTVNDLLCFILWHVDTFLGNDHETGKYTTTIAKFFFFCYWWGGTKSLGTAVTSGLLYKPQMIDEDDCGAIGGMKIGRRNRSTRRKPAPAPLSPPQIPHDQTTGSNPGPPR